MMAKDSTHSVAGLEAPTQKKLTQAVKKCGAPVAAARALMPQPAFM